MFDNLRKNLRMNCFLELIAKMLKETFQLNFLLSLKRYSKTKVDLTTIIGQLSNMGIKEGDSILVHSSMSHVEGQASDFILALQELVGPNGNILMPTHPKLVTLENEELYYDPATCESNVGYLTEYFRNLPNVKRSLHPFSSVAVLGKDADWFLSNNIMGELPLPHGINSPYAKLAEKKGKVICIGVTAQARATLSHVPEEVLDDKFPLDVTEVVDVIIKNGNVKKKMSFRRTILSFSKIYKCKSQLEKDWLNWGILQKNKINNVPIEVLDAYKCVDLMIEKVTKKGETVYPYAPDIYSKIKKKLNGRLLYVNDNNLYLAKGNKIYFSDNNGNTWKLYLEISVDFITKLIMNIPLLSRLLRKGIHHFITFEDIDVLIANKEIFYFKNRKIEAKEKIHGSRPMVLCKTRDNNLYYGEYRSNKERAKTFIWKFDNEKLTWEIAWTFEGIRHIHGVFYDDITESIWVTTGDSNSESGIWVTKNNFISLKKIVGDSQQFRAVQLLFDKNYVYFGSDAPNEQNYIYRMLRDGSHIEKLAKVGSSVFYGTKINQSYFFSTAVEPSDVNKTKYVEIWRSDNGSTWYIYKKIKKDIFSMKYFQYGQVYFPISYNNSKLYFTPFSTKKSNKTCVSNLIYKKNLIKIQLHRKEKDINKFRNLPILAKEIYLKTRSENFGWFISEHYCISFFIERRGIFQRLVFTTGIISNKCNVDLDNEKEFLDKVIEYIKDKINCDFIYKAQANVIFNVCPEKSFCVEWGTYNISLQRSSDELFLSFNQKSRNVIRRAIKNNVKFKQTTNVDIVYENIKMTLLRQASVHFPKYTYLKSLIKLNNNCAFFIVEKNNVIQGSLILLYDNSKGYAMYAGSIVKPEVGSIDLMHYEAMKYLQKKNIAFYDFVGTRVHIKKGSKQEGIDRFKRKFNPILIQGYTFKTVIKPGKYFMYLMFARVYFKMRNIDYKDPILEIYEDDKLVKL